MSYVDTSIIVAALDPSDSRSGDATKILEEETYKVISELTILELASVLSRKWKLLSDIADRLGLDRGLTIIAIILYLIRRFNLRYRGIKTQSKTTPLGRVYKPIADAVEIASTLNLRTLDLLHISYIKLLREEDEPIHKLITADKDFRAVKDYLEKNLGIHLSILE